jgi:hypothetical protein
VGLPKAARCVAGEAAAWHVPIGAHVSITIEVKAMRATISIPDERLAELMELTGEASRTAAVNVAIEAFVRQTKLQRLLALEGQVDVLSNDAIEAMDESEFRGWWTAGEDRTGDGT